MEAKCIIITFKLNFMKKNIFIYITFLCALLSSCDKLKNNLERVNDEGNKKNQNSSTQMNEYYSQIKFCKNEYQRDSLLNTLSIVRLSMIKNFGSEDNWLNHIEWLKENGGGAKIESFTNGVPVLGIRDIRSPYEPVRLPANQASN